MTDEFICDTLKLRHFIHEVQAITASTESVQNIV